MQMSRRGCVPIILACKTGFEQAVIWFRGTLGDRLQEVGTSPQNQLFWGNFFLINFTHLLLGACSGHLI